MSLEAGFRISVEKKMENCKSSCEQQIPTQQPSVEHLAVPSHTKYIRLRLLLYLITPRSLRSMNPTSSATSSPSIARIFSRACVVLSFAASK